MDVSHGSHAVQTSHLLWLDKDVDESNENTRTFLGHLKRVVDKVDIFTNIDECIDFISKINHEKVLVIISDKIGEKCVPLIHDMQQTDSIYILRTKRALSTDWTTNWQKVKGIFDGIESISAGLERTKRLSNPDSVQISIICANQCGIQNFNEIEPSFMYTQLLKEILLEIDNENDEKAIEQLASYCRCIYAGDSMELNNIDKFVREFHNHTPIWWYTYECFLYPLLNRSLRMFDVNVITKLGFFLRHLHRHIEQLYDEQFKGEQRPFIVYRGQGLTKLHFENIVNMKGGLLSFNNFLSTSKERSVSMNFARSALGHSDSVGILYTITVDPAVSSARFAAIGNVSYFGDAEQEILFCMNTIFRLEEFDKIDGNDRLWNIKLSLTADSDPRLDALLIRLRSETGGTLGWQRLARLFMRIGQHHKAEEIYKALIDQTLCEPVKAIYYHQLGCVKYELSSYHEAIMYFEKALSLFITFLPPKDFRIATTYNAMGGAYFGMGDYEKAISFYNKSIEIRLETLPADHPSLSVSYNNVAIGHSNMGDYSKALLYYKKCLEIEEKSLPLNHPDLATTYNNIGGMYNEMNEYSQAMFYYEKAMEIRQKSLPANHPDIGESYHNIGAVYCSLGEHKKALDFHEKALEIRQKSLHPNHLDLAFSYNNIGSLYSNIGDHSKALTCLEKALEIRQNALPPNHQSIATSYNDISVVYDRMGQYSKACTYLEKASVSAQHSLPDNHRYLQEFRTNLEKARKKL